MAHTLWRGGLRDLDPPSCGDSQTVDGPWIRLVSQHQTFRIGRFRLDQEGQGEDQSQFVENDQAYHQREYLWLFQRFMKFRDWDILDFIWIFTVYDMVGKEYSRSWKLRGKSGHLQQDYRDNDCFEWDQQFQWGVGYSLCHSVCFNSQIENDISGEFVNQKFHLSKIHSADCTFWKFNLFNITI